MKRAVAELLALVALAPLVCLCVRTTLDLAENVLS
jgi:hypothetical protein